MRRSSVIAIVGGVVLAMGAGAWLFAGRQDSAGTVIGPVAMNTPMPVITGQSLSGSDVGTEQLKGKVAVLNVWATWCGPCRREQPALQRLAHRYGDRVGFMGINYRDDKVAAARWADDEFHVSYPSLFDPHGKTASQLDYPFLPDTYVVDRSGTIRWVIQGETSEQELQGLIDGLLAEPSPSA